MVYLAVPFSTVVVIRILILALVRYFKLGLNTAKASRRILEWD